MPRAAIVGVGSAVVILAPMRCAGTGGRGSCLPPTHIQTRESKWHRIDTHAEDISAPVRTGTQVRELRISLAELHTTFAISGCEVWLRLHSRIWQVVCRRRVKSMTPFIAAIFRTAGV